MYVCVFNLGSIWSSGTIINVKLKYKLKVKKKQIQNDIVTS